MSAEIAPEPSCENCVFGMLHSVHQGHELRCHRHAPALMGQTDPPHDLERGVWPKVSSWCGDHVLRPNGVTRYARD